MTALIPARAGSKRIPGKNTKLLGGHPLIAYTIAAALESRVFHLVVVCSDDVSLNPLVVEMGAGYLDRARVDDDQHDFYWVRDALRRLPRSDEFCILRPTSPFRSAETIVRAFQKWYGSKDCCDSLRAVTKASQTPFKMWVPTGPNGYAEGYPMAPLCEGTHPDGTPYHSSPTQTLPTVYVQTGALEMGWTRNVEQLGSISGRKIIPFFTEGPDALDLNTLDDWARAEALVASGAVLPAVSLAGVSTGTPAE